MYRLGIWVILLSLAILPTVAYAETDAISSFSRSDNGNIEIVENGKKTVITPQEVDPTADYYIPYTTDDPVLSNDGKALGWVVEFKDSPKKSHYISYYSMMLVVYRSGHVQKLWSGAGVIWDWRFVKNGKQVAICGGPTHGNPYGFILYNVKDGGELAKVAYPLGDHAPAWAKKLKCG